MNPVRLAIICDLVEEDWPSMQLFGEKLFEHLQHEPVLRAARVCPPMRRRFSHLPFPPSRRIRFNMDRLLNRWLDYPRYLRKHVREFHLYHVSDHSYAHLIDNLPVERTGVFCYDLNAFRSVLQPNQESRPAWFRALARRGLRGLRKAAIVFYLTEAVRQEIEHHGLVDPARLVQALPGVSPEFTLDADAERSRDVLRGISSSPYLLHVGACAPRKRIDVLLQVFAEARKCLPELRLVKMGGHWSHEHLKLIERLGIGGAITRFYGLERAEIATLYRHASLTLLPSDSEGFGMPVIEALACGSRVIASDLPVLREVGGDACVYCPVADVPQWASTVCRLLADPQAAPPLEKRLAWAKQFTWEAHARTILSAYLRLV